MRAMIAFLSSENSESLDEDRFCLDVVCHTLGLGHCLSGSPSAGIGVP